MPTAGKPGLCLAALVLAASTVAGAGFRVAGSSGRPVERLRGGGGGGAGEDDGVGRWLLRAGGDRLGLEERGPRLSWAVSLLHFAIGDAGSAGRWFAEAPLTPAAAPTPSPREVPKQEAAPSAEDRSLYFRPVSTTLYCVMALTIQSLMIYTVLALSRNSDELSGKLKPSVLTETLATAARSAVFPSMLCMLFVGCRMYVLATTEGLGEPPHWVKACMIMASVGMSIQFLVVLLLPIFIDDHSSGRPFSDLAGGHSDVHPMIETQAFVSPNCMTVFSAAQVLSLAMIYGGAGGVLVGIFTFPAQKTQVSPAVVNTCFLSALYFGVFLALWLARYLSIAAGGEDSQGYYGRKRVGTPRKEAEGSGEDGGSGHGTFLRAALAMSVPVRKAPMLAVLFLAARMRALQLDPPNGMPPPWAQACFFVVTGSLCLEACMAAYIGATGVEEQGYYGTHVYSAGTAAHAAQHFWAALAYLGLVPVVAAIFLMESSDGSPAPLSTTVRAVLYLEALFFAVHLGQWFTHIMRDLFKQAWSTTQDTLLAAGVSISFVPVLCILFVATRMRALQITQQKGEPPGYAQDSMLLCMFATTVQVGCCILMPIFTNAATEVDGDGNPELDARPMVGAYAVALVKYVALFCLHGGTAAICLAVFAMTPETAMRGDQPFDTAKVLEMAGVTLVIVVLSLFLSSAKVVGLAIKFGIESADQLVIGTDIEVNKAALSICYGYVNVNGLRVLNPESDVQLEGGGTQPWRCDCLLEVEKLVVDINMWKLAVSLGKEFEIQEIVLHGVHAYAEKPSMKGTSNVGLVLDFLNKLAAEPVADKDKPEAKEPAALPAEAAPAAEEAFATDIQVRKVSIEDIGATFIAPPGFGSGIGLQLGNINFDDLSEKLDKKKGAVVGDIVGVILNTLLTTIRVNTQSTFKKMIFSKEGAAKLAQGAARKLDELGKMTGEMCTPPCSPLVQSLRRPHQKLEDKAAEPAIAEEPAS